MPGIWDINWTRSSWRKWGPVDVLMLPVGGEYTV